VYEREAEATGSRQRAARLEHRLGELEAGLAAKVPLGPGPT
jgi:BMFP domain-containing protein YqiC